MNTGDRNTNKLGLIHLMTIIPMLGVVIITISAFLGAEKLAQSGFLLSIVGILLIFILLPFANLDKPLSKNPISFSKKAVLITLLVFMAGSLNLFYIFENRRLNQELVNLVDSKNAQASYFRSDIHRLKEDMAQRDKRLKELELENRRINEAHQRFVAEIQQNRSPHMPIEAIVHKPEKTEPREAKKKAEEIGELKRGMLIIHSSPSKKDNKK